MDHQSSSGWNAGILKMYPNRPLCLRVSIANFLKFQDSAVRSRSALVFGLGQAQKSVCRSLKQPRPRLSCTRFKGSFEWTGCQVGSANKNLTFIITNQPGLCHDHFTLRTQSDLLETLQKFIFMLCGTTALSRGPRDSAR